MMPFPHRDAVALSARTLGALFSYAPNSPQIAPLVAAFQDGCPRNDDVTLVVLKALADGPAPADGTTVQTIPYTARIYTNQTTPAAGSYTDSVVVDVSF